MEDSVESCFSDEDWENVKVCTERNELGKIHITFLITVEPVNVNNRFVKKSEQTDHVFII